MSPSRRLRSQRVGALLGVCLVSVLLAGAASRPAESVQETDVGNDYRIGVGDVLDIRVWKEDSLSLTVPIRPDGKMSFPLLDDIPAAGRTCLELKTLLTGKLKEFVGDPRVTVIVREVNSYRVYILGEVTTPGALTLKSKTTLVQAIALAGGFTPYADRGEITVMRSRDKRDQRVVVDYDRIVAGKTPEHNLILEAGDTVIVR